MELATHSSCDAINLHRPGCAGGLSLWPFQHWRGEGQLYIAARYRLGRHHLRQLPALRWCRSVSRGDPAFWCFLGGDSGSISKRDLFARGHNTIMLNFIAIGLASYFTQYHYKVPGDPILQTATVGPGAHIARFGQIIPGFQRIP
jgi:hypothetical protein